jgi:hypothetical protein
VFAQLRAAQEEGHQPRPILRLWEKVGEQRFAQRGKQAPAAVGAAQEAAGFKPRRRAALLPGRLAVTQDRAAVGLGHTVRQQRHETDEAMRGARRIECGERKVERSAQARLAVVGGAASQQIGAPVIPVGRQAAQVALALRIGREQPDRQRVAIESCEQAGQGVVASELIAGVAEE